MVLEIPLHGKDGFLLRQRAFDFFGRYATTTGAERGSTEQQYSGLLAEVVVRQFLNLPHIEDDKDRNINLGYDLQLPSGVKVDVKCRGGTRPFEEEYEGSGEMKREAKHNLFARQVYDENLNTDIYLMMHLRTPNKYKMPGTERQRSWCLYVCGWVSKERVKREGVYLERGAITERGGSWFPYRGQEIEFYHRNLNPILKMEDLLNLTLIDVEADKLKNGHYNLTTIDAIRIAMDLFARGLLEKKHIEFIKNKAGIVGAAYLIFKSISAFGRMVIQGKTDNYK
ncbi:MAG: hypothetical protein HKL88_03790 [Bacteroidia bacterium]|nr:hypothetical protein [Bacteroidia bacterium]